MTKPDNTPEFRLYNTLTRTVDPVRPARDGDPMRFYVCGPTVYNYAHIGNLRTFVSVDLFRRTLKFFGIPVKHVMNITDVDDKTIRGSRAAGQSLGEFTTFYRDAFLADLDALNIERPEHMPAATENIGPMLKLIKQLEAKGAAYQSEDGTVYFRLSAFEEYGKLSRLDRDQLRSGARVSQDEYQKEGVGDFALWKPWTEDDGDVGWDSPWGRGRPGWHLECSAMSMRYLGESFDLHAGGEDLCFPHHENEIAQSEAATGKPFVRHWLHGAHLMVEGQKMSKSLGNLYTIKDIEEKGYTTRELRLALMAAHYRQNLNFTWKGMNDARAQLQRIDEWRKRWQALPASEGESESATYDDFLARFRAALADDLNLPAAIGELFTFIRETNKAMDEGKTVANLNETWQTVDAALGLGEPDDDGESADLPAEVQAILDNRAEARQSKDFAKSDELRDELKAHGWQVKDTKQGQEVTRI